MLEAGGDLPALSFFFLACPRSFVSGGQQRLPGNGRILTSSLAPVANARQRIPVSEVTVTCDGAPVGSGGSKPASSTA